jgi:hypothetical protein
MKPFKILLLLVFSAVSVSIAGQELPDKNAEKKEKIAAAVKEAVETGKIDIVIDKIITKSRNTIEVGNDYELIIKNDSLTCYLPYFGEANVAPIFPADVRVEFKDEKLTFNKCNPRPGIYLIKFTTKSDIGLETFSFTITIFESAFCIINLAPSKRDYIIYHGTLKY